MAIWKLDGAGRQSRKLRDNNGDDDPFSELETIFTTIVVQNPLFLPVSSLRVMQPDECHSEGDAARFLLRWLVWTEEQTESVEDWTLRASFRRGFHLHLLYENPKSGLWAFHVDENRAWDGQKDPLFGYHNSLGKLIDHVSAVYWNRWKPCCRHETA